ncbi:hypothetical protein FQR65_LT03059 [Abscondita terminalis]|nr:hypothetical protein FQR65_LT03059 [Abscondita terminalis]
MHPFCYSHILRRLSQDIACGMWRIWQLFDVVSCTIRRSSGAIGSGIVFGQFDIQKEEPLNRTRGCEKSPGKYIVICIFLENGM